jgi:hypothetical protein
LVREKIADMGGEVRGIRDQRSGNGSCWTVSRGKSARVGRRALQILVVVVVKCK